MTKPEWSEAVRQGAEPTALCRLVLADAPEIIGRMQLLHDRLGQLRGGSGEEVAVATGPFPMALCLAATREFRRAHPRVELNVIEDNGDYLQHLLIGGELDVAVMLTSSVRDRTALHVETLLVSPYRLWLPLGHPLAQQEAIALEDVAGQPLIQLMVDEIEESTRRLTAALPVKPQIAFRTRSVEAVRSLVATGAGLAILPSLVYRPWSLEGQKIERIAMAESIPPLEIGIVWKREADITQAMELFISFLRQTVRREGND